MASVNGEIISSRCTEQQIHYVTSFLYCHKSSDKSLKCTVKTVRLMRKCWFFYKKLSVDGNVTVL